MDFQYMLVIEAMIAEGAARESNQSGKSRLHAAALHLGDQSPKGANKGNSEGANRFDSRED